MKIVDRIIFIIVALFLLAISAALVLVGAELVTMEEVIGYLSDFKVDRLMTVILFVCAFILFIVAVKILIVRPKKNKIPAYTIKKSDEGDISVSITAIENTVKLAMANFGDVKDVKIHIGVNQQGIAISAKLFIPAGVMLPTLLAEVQTFTKDFVKTLTGVNVASLKLVATEYKSVDTANERKKLEKSKTTDQYAGTHSRVVLNDVRPVEAPVIEVEPIAPKAVNDEATGEIAEEQEPELTADN